MTTISNEPNDRPSNVESSDEFSALVDRAVIQINLENPFLLNRLTELETSHPDRLVQEEFRELSLSVINIISKSVNSRSLSDTIKVLREIRKRRRKVLGLSN